MNLAQGNGILQKLGLSCLVAPSCQFEEYLNFYGVPDRFAIVDPILGELRGYYTVADVMRTILLNEDTLNWGALSPKERRVAEQAMATIPREYRIAPRD